MRSLLALLLALLAGLSAVLATAGALVDEAAHRPELVRGVAEQVASDEQVRAAIPGAVTGAVEDLVPEEVPDPLTQAVEDLIRPVAQNVAQDPSVVQGWSDTADEARRAWLLDLKDARGTEGFVPGGDFIVPFGPVAQSGVAAALGDIETRLRRNELDVPGQGILEAVTGTDFGDWAADTVIAPMYDRAAELRDSTDLTMTVTVDSLKDVDRSTVAWWAAASAHWRWAAVAAGLLLLAALVLARPRWRGPSIALAGAVMLVGGMLLGNATRSDAFSVVAPDGVADGVAHLAVEAQRALRPAIDTALTPYAATLTTAAWITLGVGVVVFLLELALTRGRPRR